MDSFAFFLYLSVFLAFLKRANCEYPSFDGYGNNIQNPSWGSSESYYVRIQAPAAYSDGVSALSNINAPSPLLVSDLVFPAANRLVQNNERISDFAAVWGQFTAHDTVLTPNDPILTFNITVPDCVFAAVNPCDGIMANITLPRAASIGLVDGARAIQNSNTAFVDASHIYGANDERANLVRLAGTPFLSAQSSGLLLPNIPIDGNDLMAGVNPRRFLAGDPRANENPALTALHTLFMREHNRKATILQAANPLWDDDQVFQEARKWVIGVMQKITYDEYLPLIIGEKLPDYTGYNATVNPGADAFFMAASFRYGHSAVSPFILRLTNTGEEHPHGHLLLRDVFFNPIPIYDAGIEPILRGLLMQCDSEVDSIIIDDLRKYYFGQPFDLVAVNTMRGRDVGIPSYNDMREALGLPRAESWIDITIDQDVSDRLKQAYGDIDLVDAYIGGLAEDHVDSAIVGPLFYASIRDQFLRSRDGNRFWYQSVDMEMSADDLTALSTMTLAQLITLNTNGDIPTLPMSAFVVPMPQDFSFINGLTTSSSSSNSTIGKITLTDSYSVSWNTTANSVNFILLTNNTGWFGIGFGENGMVNADLVICSPASSTSSLFSCADYWSVDQNPVLDTSIGGTNDVTNVQDITQQEIYHKRAVTFSRKISTGDTKDNVIGTGLISMLYAFGTDTVIQYHGPSNRGIMQLSLFSSSDDSTAFSSSSSITAQTIYFIFHGTVMAISFFVLIPVAIFVARHPEIYETWLKRHEDVMTKVFHLAVFDILVVVLSSFSNGSNFSSFTHARIGYSMACILTLNVIFGTLAKRINSESLDNQKMIRKVHQVLGWTAFLLGLLNCCLGIKDITIGFKSTNIFAAIIGALAIVVLCVEFYFERFISPWLLQNKKAKLNRFGSQILASKHLPKFEWEEIHYRIEKGAHWIVMDGAVYDVEEFRFRHPGGQEILSGLYGIDAYEIYRGQKSFVKFVDSNDPATGRHVKNMVKNKYAHSRLAQSELSNLAVGIVSNGNESGVINNVIDSPREYIQLKLSEKVPIARSSSDSRTTYKFVFSFPDKKMKMPVLPGDAVILRLVFAGRIVTRFYSPFQCENDGCLVLFIKVYEDGIFTSMLDQLTIGAEIFMRGPFCLTPDAFNSSAQDGRWKQLGLIGAGTGIAPMLLFIDHHLKHLSYDKDGNPDCKIHLLIVCSSSRDLIGAEIVEQFKERAKNALEVFYVFSNQIISNRKTEENVYHGRITKEILIETMPRPIEALLISRKKLYSVKDNMCGLDNQDTFSNSSNMKRNLSSSSHVEMVMKTAELHPIRESPLIEGKPWNGSQNPPGLIVEEAKDDLRIFISGNTDFNSSVSTMLQDLGYFSKNIVILENTQTIHRLPSSISGLNPVSQKRFDNLTQKHQ